MLHHSIQKEKGQTNGGRRGGHILFVRIHVTILVVVQNYRCKQESIENHAYVSEYPTTHGDHNIGLSVKDI